MIDKLRITILAEDKRHQSFVLKYLKCLRCESHKIRRVPLPNGSGAGEQWVRERYAKEISELRRLSERVALIVVIDSDTVEVERRRSQLEKGLQSPREAHELIVHFIPKRNIETWILFLNGQNVDEIENHRKDPGIDDRVGPAAQAFYSWTRPNAAIPTHCIPSLFAAIPEAQRLEQ